MKREQLDNVYLRAMFYGDSGSGKTRLLGTAMECEDTRPMLLLNARGQPVSLRFLGDNTPLVLTVETMSDFNITFDWIMRNQPVPKVLRNVEWGSEEFYDLATNLPEPFNYIYPYLAEYGAERFKTLGVDSITQIQRIANNAVLDNPDVYVPDHIPDRRGYAEYQKLLDMMMFFADKHYSLPVHVLMTALCRHNEMPTLGITKYYPFLWGQGALEVPSYAELVGRLVNIESLTTQKINALANAFEPEEEGERPFNVLYTRGGRSFMAKWQGPASPPPVVVNPTVEKLLDVLKAG
jgi:hypothetical protein